MTHKPILTPPRLSFLAIFYDELIERSSDPLANETRGLPIIWKEETCHRVARDFGKENGWNFYRFGYHLGWGEYEILASIYKVWRYI